MPIEVMARRGEDTMRFGPLRPVGLRGPQHRPPPWAVVQLRRREHRRHASTTSWASRPT